MEDKSPTEWKFWNLEQFKEGRKTVDQEISAFYEQINDLKIARLALDVLITSKETGENTPIHTDAIQPMVEFMHRHYPEGSAD